MSIHVSEEQAEALLAMHCEDARSMLKDEQKLIKLLNGVVTKVVSLESEDPYIHMIPILSSFVASHVKGEYVKASEDQIVLIVSALIYFMSRNDLILDSVPELGYLDDVAVIKCCMKEVADVVFSYKKYRNIV